MLRFRKLPVEIEAVTVDDLMAACRGRPPWSVPPWFQAAYDAGTVTLPDLSDGLNAICIQIKTLEGTMFGERSDWIIRGVNGELYPCKAEIFAKTYEPVDVATTLEVKTTFDFAQALQEVKSGRRVTRSGWNGRGMWIALQRGYPNGVPINRNTAQATGLPEGTVCTFLPYLLMRTAGGEFVPWLASQTDLLAEDWSVVEESSAMVAATRRFFKGL